MGLDVRAALDRERHPYLRALVMVLPFAAVLSLVLAVFAVGDLSAVTWLFPMKVVVYTPILLGLAWFNESARRRADLRA